MDMEGLVQAEASVAESTAPSGYDLEDGEVFQDIEDGEIFEDADSDVAAEVDGAATAPQTGDTFFSAIATSFVLDLPKLAMFMQSLDLPNDMMTATGTEIHVLAVVNTLGGQFVVVDEWAFGTAAFPVQFFPAGTVIPEIPETALLFLDVDIGGQFVMCRHDFFHNMLHSGRVINPALFIGYENDEESYNGASPAIGDDIDEENDRYYGSQETTGTADSEATTEVESDSDYGGSNKENIPPPDYYETLA